MSTYELAQKEQAKIMEQAVLTAYAVIAILGRKEDELSSNEAYKLYGKGWIIDRTERGMLHTSRHGSTSKSAKVYSRFEIESLKRAENHIAEAYDAAESKVASLKEFMEQRN